jgi:hypothetical protein
MVEHVEVRCSLISSEIHVGINIALIQYYIANYAYVNIVT